MRRSGDDVGRDLIFDEGDAIAQRQLPLLQSLQPQQVRRGRMMQRIDRCVEIAVLLLQLSQLGTEVALVFVGHDQCRLEPGRERRAGCGGMSISSASLSPLRRCEQAVRPRIVRRTTFVR
uniref:Uncharacterized protein n=1 Tax=Rhodopseudomonas palustris (strain ATCC BAA-98 / CGA009) TaxID=258594 RepID=Q6N278_RHOPA|nr:hypothetical protein RPA4172 [Rhodopseudomonas palustris CGA009]